MDLSSDLLRLLVCPVSKKGNLYYDKANQEIISPDASLAYPIVDGIPLMLVEKARKIVGKDSKIA